MAGKTDPAKIGTNPIRIGSTSDDFYVHAVDLARVLKVTDNEISRLVRSAVMVRVSDPNHGKSFLYPVFDNITRYVLHTRSKKEKAYQAFIAEKAATQKAQREKTEMQNAAASGKLVDKAKLISRLEPIVTAYRNSVLARADRLERTLFRAKGHKAKVAAIREADLDSLHVLSDLFKMLDSAHSGGNVRSSPKKAS